MSDRAMRAIRAVQDVTASQKAVLMVIADHADTAGECFLSVALIVAESCSSERTVQRAMAALVASGHLQADLRKGVGYSLRLPCVVHSTPVTVAGTPVTLTGPPSP